MKTKTFRGESVHALMRQVRSELGDNVVILNTREDGTSSVEIEIGLLEGMAEEDRTPTVEQEEPSLSLLADLYRETDPLSALKLSGVEGEIIAKCAPYLRGAVLDSELLGKALGKVLKFQSRLPQSSRVIALLGPTGVGKTTTIAKLAARLQMALGLRIGLIAADGYRIGAEFHLGAFAKLLGAPIATLDESLPGDQQLPAAITKLDTCDLIFVDTPGASPRDGDRLRELSALFVNAGHVDKCLVLSAPSNDYDLSAAASAYTKLGCERVIVSKVDESGFLGPVINTVYRSGLPLAFITNGQRVPEDIEPASARRLAWMIMRRMH